MATDRVCVGIRNTMILKPSLPIHTPNTPHHAPCAVTGCLSAAFWLKASLHYLKLNLSLELNLNLNPNLSKADTMGPICLPIYRHILTFTYAYASFGAQFCMLVVGTAGSVLCREVSYSGVRTLRVSLCVQGCLSTLTAGAGLTRQSSLLGVSEVSHLERGYRSR